MTYTAFCSTSYHFQINLNSYIEIAQGNSVNIDL